MPSPDALDPRLTPARPDLADVRLRGRVEAARFVAGEPRRVRVPSAPLRRAPAPGAGIDTEALMGDPVTVYERRDGHAWVQLGPDGYVGYLPDVSIGPADPAPTHRVAALRTFLYPAPDLKRAPLGHLSLGAGVYVRAVVGDYLDTEAGFVFAGHCRPAGETVSDPVAVAERLIGTPYLWGGRTSLGLDCSGLVQICLAAAGRACPRDADQQERALGRPLGAGEGLARGDLVFWRGHVGVMRDPTTLIHANGHHMAVAAEPYAEACARIAVNSYGAVTGLRRL